MKLEFNDITCNINPRGAYLEELKTDNYEIIRKSPDGHSTHGGSAVLFPFGNRIRNAEYKYMNKEYRLPANDGENSIHGLVRDLDFDYDGGSSYVEFYRHFQSDSYPGEAMIKIKYEIGKNSFKTTFKVKSITGLIPVEIGFHPYFKVNGKYSVSYKGTMEKLEYVDTHFPDGKTFPVDLNGKELNSMNLDNTFYTNSSITLHDNFHSIIIRRTNMPYLVIYNGQYAGNNSVAIEPMTGAPDAYHNGMGLISLPRGKDFECSYSIDMF
jgi:aldose 1-epimerase